MAAVILFIVGSWAQFVGAPAAPIEAPQPAPVVIRGYVTHYTCVHHTQNAMTNTPGSCRYTADGSDPLQPGIACPDRSWLGQMVEVPGYGVLRCDDTPRRSHLYGLPHFDIRLVGVDAYQRALQAGAYESDVYLVE